MAQICEACGELNPATNRYCGQCGKKLERAAADLPAEFRRAPGGPNQAGQVEASADLPPEVIAFDNQIPLIAAEGSDRRHPAPAEMAGQMRDHLEREAEIHDSLRHGGETHFEARAKEEAERMSRMEILRWKEAELESGGVFLPWNINPAVDEPASLDGGVGGATVDGSVDASLDGGVGGATVDGSVDAIMDRASEPGAQPPPQRDFPAEDEAAGEEKAADEEVRTGVSGPSFLGLTDDYLPQCGDEDGEPESHTRRNIALALVAAVVILVALQWRSIRDYGMAHIPDGFFAATQGGKQSSAATPAVVSNASKSSSSHSTRPPARATARPRSMENRPNTSVSSAGHNQLAAKMSKFRRAPAAPPAAVRHLSAMSAPTAKTPKTEPPPAAPPAVAPRAAAPPAAAAGKPRPAPPAAHETAPGADEMNRAAHAGDAELRAVWLWRALGKGNLEAPVELARMYEQGDGVVQSCDQAQVLLRSAAAKGNEQAKLNLQQIHRRGGCSGR